MAHKKNLGKSGYAEVFDSGPTTQSGSGILRSGSIQCVPNCINLAVVLVIEFTALCTKPKGPLAGLGCATGAVATLVSAPGAGSAGSCPALVAFAVFAS